MVKKYQSLFDMLGDAHVEIPCSDADAWVKFTDHHHIYNKLWIAEVQRLPCGPMGVYPNRYPVIFKPILNLYGMSRGTKIISNEEQYDENIRDGLFWEEYLQGTHRCIDLVVTDGQIHFISCLESVKGPVIGTFDYHKSVPDYKLPNSIKNWIETIFDDYKGCINIETINDKIIECHLRLNGDAQLYDQSFADQLINFINGTSNSIQTKIDQKYIIPLFVKKGFSKLSNDEVITALCDQYGANSVHFDDPNSINQSEHMSRLLIFDIYDLQLGLELREAIKKYLMV
jgi:hypothetical protein